MKLLFTFLTFIILSCNSKSQIATKAILKSDSTNIIQDKDSIEKSFMNGEYFMTTFIRLNKNEFIYIEDDYVKNNIRNKKVKDLYFKTESLNKNNREDFYKKIISGLPKEDVEIHKMVWNINEVKEQGKNGDGGLYTLATWIVDKPTPKNPFYSIEVRRNYYDRFGICLEIGYIKINSKTRQILVNDIESGEDLPIEEWRKLKMERQ